MDLTIRLPQRRGSHPLSSLKTEIPIPSTSKHRIHDPKLTRRLGPKPSNNNSQRRNTVRNGRYEPRKPPHRSP